jgi:hypothetical protein
MRVHSFRSGRFVAIVWAIGALCTPVKADAQCSSVLTADLRAPLGITQSNLGNLLVSETGTTGTLHSGRLSIVGRDGVRRTLLDGLPSATNDVNEASGPSGILIRGRTLYVLIGIGDTIQVVTPGSPIRVGNPNPSSRIFSSILAIHLSANVERTAGGFSITTSDQQALANGEKLRLSTGGGDTMTIEVVANFPDYIPNPLPGVPNNVRGSNPFDLDLIGDQLFVTDGGRNLVWKVNINTGTFSPLAEFAPIANPTPVGAPIVEAVPTGIREFKGQLFVTLFRGFPFPPGTSVVQQINPNTGAQAPLFTGLRTAIDVLVSDDEPASVLVLQHASGPLLPPFSGPGSLTRLDAGGSNVVADCLARPTSMVRDERTNVIYITEYLTGRVVMVQ